VDTLQLRDTRCAGYSHLPRRGIAYVQHSRPGIVPTSLGIRRDRRWANVRPSPTLFFPNSDALSQRRCTRTAAFNIRREYSIARLVRTPSLSFFAETETRN